MARVAVDLPLPHLDRPFDYLVPQRLSAAARPGVRVRVAFAGQSVDGWLLERLERSGHTGRLAPLRRVVSPEPVLTPQLITLARAVADHYAGTLSDVLRLAIPPRHARAESQAEAESEAECGAQRDAGPGPAGRVPPPRSPHSWSAYRAGPAFVTRLAAGQAPRAVWSALPGLTWTGAVAEAVAATLGSGRGSLVVVPDRRDLDHLEQALIAALGPDRHVRLTADLGPQARYAAFLRLLHGRAQVAIGTRGAVFAPVARLGLVVIWDDGDEQHAELRAPYPHARQVLRLRAEQSGAAALIGGWSRSVEAAALVARGWAQEIAPDRAGARARWPRVITSAEGRADDDPAAQLARMPPVAWRTVHAGLLTGPVLVQVARSGYLPGMACQRCRRAARCPHCRGPVALVAAPAAGSPSCRWCGRTLPDWTCPTCGGSRLRARAVGVERTAEELGRAFPGARVVLSRPDRDLPVVPPGRTLVLATSGIEPPAQGGYAAAVLLDGDTLLERSDLRAGEEALRRWRAAAALVRPASEGGLVVACADPTAAAVQALLRGDPAGFAERERRERAELALPPEVAAATVTGPAAAVAGLLRHLPSPQRFSLLGPTPSEGGTEADGEPQVRALLRAPLAEAALLAGALRTAAAARSARREPGAVRIQIDPRDVG